MQGRQSKQGGWRSLQEFNWLLVVFNSNKTRSHVSSQLVVKSHAESYELHFKAAKRVLSYIKGTEQLGIWYRKSNDSMLVGYTDGDWAGSIEDIKSTSGYVFFLNSSAFSWNSKKQVPVAKQQLKQSI